HAPVHGIDAGGGPFGLLAGPERERVGEHQRALQPFPRVPLVETGLTRARAPPNRTVTSRWTRHDTLSGPKYPSSVIALFESTLPLPPCSAPELPGRRAPNSNPPLRLGGTVHHVVILLLWAIVLAFIIGYATGGRLRNLEHVRLRAWPLAVG